MKWIKRLPREEGPGGIGEILTHLDDPRLALELTAKARLIANAAEMNLFPHRRTGRTQIHVVPPKRAGGTTDVDAHVYLSNPKGWETAASIELGHAEYDHHGKPTGRHVEGLHILRDAVAEVHAKAIF